METVELRRAVNDMLNMNTEMKKIISAEVSKNFSNKTKLFLEEIVSNTKIIKDCVIYDNEGINESDINWDNFSKYVRDLTEYEVDCNEFRIEKNEINNSQYQKLAYKMHDMLKSKFPNRKFAVYVCINGDYIEIRFHTYRITEGLWLDEHLDKYSNPVLCLWDND